MWFDCYGGILVKPCDLIIGYRKMATCISNVDSVSQV